MNLKSPRILVLYLLLVSVGVFCIKRPEWLLAIALGQFALGGILGLRLRRLVRRSFKLLGLFSVILLSFAFAGTGDAGERWRVLSLFGVSFHISVTGVFVGTAMVLRVWSIVLASQLPQSLSRGGIAQGLRGLFVPRPVAEVFGAVLALLGDDADGPGRGKGRGEGRGTRRGRRGGSGRGEGRRGGAERYLDDQTDASKEATTQPDEGEKARRRGIGRFVNAVRELKSEGARPLVRGLEERVQRARQHLETREASRDANSRAVSADAAVVAGFTLTMLGVKALKILPAVPFAPGHKLVLLTPLYVLVAVSTRSRFGASWTGLTMGGVAFLLGDGKYGIFEILKHIAPGLVCDLLAPIVFRGGHVPSKLVCTLVGALTGTARFGTIFIVIALLQTPAYAYAIFLPGLAIHTGFGAVAGYLSYFLLRDYRLRA